jgi:hypothetical protein
MNRWIWVKRWRAFQDDGRAVVLVEMAMIMPVVIVLALGGFEITRFALLQQKLDRLSVTVADMVAQSKTISVGDLDQIFAATSSVMAPFAVGNVSAVIVSSVSATGGQAAQVGWQRNGGGTLAAASEVGAVSQPAVLPNGFVVRSGENAIIAESYYDFTPMFIPDLVPPQRLYHRAMFRPRFGSLAALSP